MVKNRDEYGVYDRMSKTSVMIKIDVKIGRFTACDRDYKLQGSDSPVVTLLANYVV